MLNFLTKNFFFFFWKKYNFRQPEDLKVSVRKQNRNGLYEKYYMYYSFTEDHFNYNTIINVKEHLISFEVQLSIMSEHTMKGMKIKIQS